MKTIFKTLFHDLADWARRLWQRWLEPDAPSWAASAIMRSIPGRRGGAGTHEQQWQCAMPSAFVRSFRRTRSPDRRLSTASLLCGPMLTALCFTPLGAAPSVAQTRCGEGRTAGGFCANVALAQAMRQTAIIFSQPKISYTAYPVMPSEDFRFRYPYELNPNSQPPSPAGTLAPN